MTKANAQASRSRSAIDAPQRKAIRFKLLRWYDANRRDLPWRRRAHDPYAQWIAEIMLQQTRVDTVMAYYEPFLRKFPTVLSLAHANDEQVLKCWEGLGYYRRALHLRNAARVVSEHGGRIPQDSASLRRLPGVGRYTATAIASIAFNERIAAVDGNVARVLARLFGLVEDVQSSQGTRRIHELASELVPVKRPGDFNQAWMDLGSIICTPNTPNCKSCPLRCHCVAFASDQTDLLPIRNRSRGRAIPQVNVVVGVFTQGRRFLMRRRPLHGLWSGLWEFPCTDLAVQPMHRGNGKTQPDRSTQSPQRAHGQAFLQLADDVGVGLKERPQDAGEVRHRLTHRLMVFRVLTVDVVSCNGRAFDRSYRWVTHSGFRRLSVSTAHRRIHAAVWND